MNHTLHAKSAVPGERHDVDGFTEFTPSPNEMVYVIDDDATVRRVMAEVLSAQGHSVRQFESAEGFLRTTPSPPAGCIVLDVRMPGGMGGLELQSRLVERGVRLPVILVTGAVDIQDAVAGMRNGAIDVLNKPVSIPDFLSRVREALIHDRERRRTDESRRRMRERFATLTAREREVLSQVVVGATDKRIAADLGVTPQAVGARRREAMEKLGVGSIAELVRAAIEAGWHESIPPQPPVAEDNATHTGEDPM